VQPPGNANSGEGNPDTLPDSNDPGGLCPWCRRISSFSNRSQYPLNPKGYPSQGAITLQRVTVLQCQGCQKGVAVIEDMYVGETRHGGSGQASYHGFHWWPTPGDAPLDPVVPSNVADSYREAMRCLGAQAPNGAVAMFRTALTWIVENKGSLNAQAKSDLKDKIKATVADGGFTSALGDWADHVRLYGNAGAHPDKFGDVTLEEAEDVGRLTYSLIEALYILPENIARRQAQRRP
jgi:hypothetical protein